MEKAVRSPLALVALGAALVSFAACSVDVQKTDGPGGKTVDVRTPVGDVSVRTDKDAPDIGMPIYPGSRPSQSRHDEPENADVNITSSIFGLQVRAAKYDSDDAQDTVVEYYRKEMRTFGEVTVCRGEVDFKGRDGAKRPVCKEKPFSKDIHLVTGTEEHQRIVGVKPRGEGSEIALVRLDMRGED